MRASSLFVFLVAGGAASVASGFVASSLGPRSSAVAQRWLSAGARVATVSPRTTRVFREADTRTDAKRHPSRLYVSFPLDEPHDNFEEDEECLLHPPHPLSPSSIFGTPIDAKMKKLNVDCVHLVKALVFDTMYAGYHRAFARFYVLETIARMPYFSYLCVLHLYETLGLWRRAELLKVHFAESWNEAHHLLITEELGGNQHFLDRFLAQHIAFGYFWTVVALYLINPVHAYNLNQAIEEEAYETYDNFLKEHGDYLKTQPAPQAAIDYYTGGDLYLFDQMHQFGGKTTHEQSTQRRRPVCETLYDCFANIRDDEAEHVKTMEYLQDTTADDPQC